MNPISLRSKDTSFAWLEREKENLVTAAAQAMTCSKESTARLGLGLTFAIHWYIGLVLATPEIVSINQQALDIAERLDDRMLQAHAHNGIAMTLIHLGRFDEAAAHHKKQLTLCRELSDRFGEQRALANLANICVNLNRYDEALQHAEEQLKIAKEIRADVGERYALMMIGRARYGLGQFDQAVTSLCTAVTLTTEADDIAQKTMALFLLGKAYLDVGNPGEAKKCLREALFHARTTKARIFDQRLLVNLARSCRLLGQLDEALSYITKAIAVAQERGKNVWDEDALKEQAEILSLLRTK